MIPTVLFDKSFLQSLSVDESVWFDIYFSANIVPIFLVETLADLEKAIGRGRTPEQEVGLIAVKTPQIHCFANVLHYQLCLHDLLGNSVPMDGQIKSAAQAKTVKTGDKYAVFVQESQEAEALRRWHQGEFLDVERQFAKLWRRMLGSFSQEETLRCLNLLGITSTACRTLTEARSIADSVVTRKYANPEILELALSLLRIPETQFKPIRDRWTHLKRPPLSQFAAYASFVLSIELFYYVAASSNLIHPKKASNKIDLSYLFYLPFSMIFVSSDKLHRECAPLFMRNNQDFIWGPVLKEDLGRIDCCYDGLPLSVKESGIISIASTPPLVLDSLVTTLWHRHCPGWRPSAPDSTSWDRRVVNYVDQRVQAICRARYSESDQVNADTWNPEEVLTRRIIYKKRGKWWQVPKNFPIKGGGGHG